MMLVSPQEASESLFHEVATLFPPMSDEEFAHLVNDIAQRGLIEPIWMHQGKIIDGVHRYRACRQLGIEPSYRQWDANGSLVAFVVACNLHRRHLSSTQRAVVALEIEKYLAVEARQNQSVSGGDKKSLFQKIEKAIVTPVHAAKQAAAAMNTNHQYVITAKQIAFNAPELVEPMKRGEMSMAEAKLLVPLSEEARALALQARAEKRVKTIKAAIWAQKRAAIHAQAQAAPEKPQIALASWECWLPEQPLCDLLLTDPPYSTDVEDIEAFTQAWLPLALSKVKSTGRAYVCIGAYPEEIRAYLNVQACLPVKQILVWTYKNTLGPKPVREYKQNWQAILYFYGPDAPALDCSLLTEQFTVQEVNAPDGRRGNREHAWQKPDALAEMLIRQSTKPGDVVYDPFCGTGTFLLAAQRLGRVGVGCEVSAEMLALAEQRGCAIAQ